MRLGISLICLPILASVPVLAGCSDAGQRSHPAESAWRFERIDGQRPATTGADLDGPELRFAGDRIGVHAGCNSLDGPWRMDRDRLLAGPLAQSDVQHETEGDIACDGSAWDQQNALNALLVAAPRVAVDGNRMTLQSSGHTAELVRITDPATTAGG